MEGQKTILVTGGAGYVGAVLVPKLLLAGYAVKVLDLYLYGDDVLAPVRGNPNLVEIKGDIRDRGLLEKVIPGVDAVIHLACISNDPSFELDPALGKSINYDAFIPLVEVARDGGVKRFIYASSSSVYGVKEEEDVTEDLPLTPLTDYSKYKALCEEVLLEKAGGRMVPVIVRPATVCGYSPRLRLDLTVNILTNHAVHNRKITVFGGEQKRPNIHIQDMTDLYLLLLALPEKAVARKVFNAGYQNLKVNEIANIVRDEVGEGVEIVTTSTNDMRSYHVSSEKIKREIGFKPKHSVQDAVRELIECFREGKVPDSMQDPRYYNIKMMQTVQLR